MTTRVDPGHRGPEILHGLPALVLFVVARRSTRFPRCWVIMALALWCGALCDGPVDGPRLIGHDKRHVRCLARFRRIRVRFSPRPVKSQSSRELKGSQDEPEGHRGLCAVLALGFDKGC
jgi:hypothetical protein